MGVGKTLEVPFPVSSFTVQGLLADAHIFFMAITMFGGGGKQAGTAREMVWLSVVCKTWGRRVDVTNENTILAIFFFLSVIFASCIRQRQILKLSLNLWH